MSDAEKLLETLGPIQGKKGFLFNADRRQTIELLEALVVNRKRYGYMSCPCRLASGERESDRDIICPCTYRDDDVKEFGSCYCALYVSHAWNENPGSRKTVPERRPPEKVC